jgi:predicted permease
MLVVLETEWRGAEIAVRRAVGATPTQLTRQFIVEGISLALAGGLGGLALGALGIRLLVALAPPQIPRLADVGLHPLVAAFTLTVAVASGLAFACFPTILLKKATVEARVVPGPLRYGLVASQLALAVMLLTGAGLMLRTSWNLLGIDRGFRTDHVLLFNLTISGPQAENAIAFHGQMLDRLEAVPGVVSATAGPFGMPIESSGNANPVWVEGAPIAPNTMPDFHPFRIVMPGYFETFGIPIREGRAIDRRDIEQQTGAVVVSEQFARRVWPGETAIGKRVRQVPTFPWATVVGVATDTRDAALTGASESVVYWPAMGIGGRTYTSPTAMTYAVHTTGDPRGLVPAVREAVRELAPAVPLASMRTMEEAQRRSMSRVSFTMTLLVIGAAMALLLAAVGTYGVMAYMVSRRTREIGVRMALGASPDAIRGMVFNQGLGVIAQGLAAGLAGAAGAMRFLQAFLFGVSPIDPLTFGAAATLLLAAAAAACYVPARRATRVDPIVAVRAD